MLPAIYEKVKAFFQKAINTIGEWIRKGVQYVKDLIDIIFDSYDYWYVIKRKYEEGGVIKDIAYDKPKSSIARHSC